jgi:hypothetical protein
MPRFGLSHNTAMFLIYPTGFTQDGTLICVTMTIYPADRDQFRYHFDHVLAEDEYRLQAPAHVDTGRAELTIAC